MKREEHYCDICGKQITGVFSDGDQYKTGIEIMHEQEVCVSMSIKRDYGTSSRSTHVTGKEFCSVECFEKSVLKMLADVREFMK